MPDDYFGGGRRPSRAWSAQRRGQGFAGQANRCGDRRRLQTPKKDIAFLRQGFEDELSANSFRNTVEDMAFNGLLALENSRVVESTTPKSC